MVGLDGVYKVDHKSMVGRNKSSDQILQQGAGKSSSLEGTTATTDNMVVLKTNPGGQGSFRTTFPAKRKWRKCNEQGLLAYAFASEDLKLPFSQYECKLMIYILVRMSYF